MIGIFDSGIGGLTTVRAIKDILPEYDIVYFGDTARTPYGSKSRETVINYSLENTRFLIRKGARIIIMACNTASSVATSIIKENFDIPVFEVISPAVDQALKLSARSNIGVIGTRATINSGIYKMKIHEKKPEVSVHSAPCPLLVPLVEEGWLNKPETKTIVKKYLHPLKVRQIDTLILGCTHYPILKDVIRSKTGKNIKIIDSSTAVAQSVANYLNRNPEVDSTMQKNGNYQFFVSDITAQFEKTAEMILKQKISLEKISL